MTNTEARDALAVAFPRLTWRLGGTEAWASVYGTLNGIEFAVSPPDVPGFTCVGQTSWRCSVRNQLAATAMTRKQRDEETLPDLVRRTTSDLAAWVDSVRQAADPSADTVTALRQTLHTRTLQFEDERKARQRLEGLVDEGAYRQMCEAKREAALANDLERMVTNGLKKVEAENAELRAEIARLKAVSP